MASQWVSWSLRLLPSSWSRSQSRCARSSSLSDWLHSTSHPVQKLPLASWLTFTRLASYLVEGIWVRSWTGVRRLLVQISQKHFHRWARLWYRVYQHLWYFATKEDVYQSVYMFTCKYVYVHNIQILKDQNTSPQLKNWATPSVRCKKDFVKCSFWLPFGFHSAENKISSKFAFDFHLVSIPVKLHLIKC